MDQYDGQTDTELEARFQDLYMQIMGGFDSLPLATWTPEYRAARREIQTWEIEFRTIGTELARRLNERASRWNETMEAALNGILTEPCPHDRRDWHCMGCGADYDGAADLHICLPGGPNHE